MKASNRNFNSFGQQRIGRDDSSRQLKQNFGYRKTTASTNSGNMVTENHVSSFGESSGGNSDYSLIRNLQNATENLVEQSDGSKQGIPRCSNQTHRIPQRKQYAPNSKETNSNKLSMSSSLSTTEIDKDEGRSMKPLQSTPTDSSLQRSKLKKPTGVPRGLQKPLAVEAAQNEELNDVDAPSPRIARSLKKPLQSGSGNDESSITTRSKSPATVRSLKKPLQSTSGNDEMSVAICSKSPRTARSLKQPMQSGLKKTLQISASGGDFEATGSSSQVIDNNEMKPLQSNLGGRFISAQTKSCLKQPNQISKTHGGGNTKGILKPQEIQRNIYNAGCTAEKKPVQCDADREDATMTDQKTSDLNNDIEKPLQSTGNITFGDSTPSTARRSGNIKKPDSNDTLGNTTPAVSRKAGVSKYDERQAIKPRAVPNKGRAGKVSSNKQSTGRKESVISSQEMPVTKRATVESKTVDCNLQKKSFQDQKSTDKKFQENDQQSADGTLGANQGSKIGMLQTTSGSETQFQENDQRLNVTNLSLKQGSKIDLVQTTAGGSETQFQEMKSRSKSIAFEVEFREADCGSKIKALGSKNANRGRIGYGNSKAVITQNGRMKPQGKSSESSTKHSSPKKVSFEDEAIAVRRKLSEQKKERISKNDAENDGTRSLRDQSTIDSNAQRDQRRKDASSKNKGQLMIIGSENGSDAVLTSFKKDIMNDDDNRPIASEFSENWNQQTKERNKSSNSSSTHPDNPDDGDLANLSNPNGKHSIKLTAPGNLNRNPSGKLAIIANLNCDPAETPTNLSNSNTRLNADHGKFNSGKSANSKSGLRKPKSFSHAIKPAVLERTHDKASQEVSKREVMMALEESHVEKSKNSQERKISPLVVKEHDATETNTLASKDNTWSDQNNITKTDNVVLASFVGSGDINGRSQIKTSAAHSDGDLRSCEGAQIMTNRKASSDWANQTGSLDRVSLKRRNEQRRREIESREKFKSVSDRRIMSVSSENVHRLDIAFTSFGKTADTHRNDSCSANTQEFVVERKLGGSNFSLSIVDEENASQTFDETQAGNSQIGHLSSSVKELGSNTRLTKLDEEEVARNVKENECEKHNSANNQATRGADPRINLSLNLNLSAGNWPNEDNSVTNGPNQHVHSSNTKTDSQRSALEKTVSSNVNKNIVNTKASFLESNRSGKYVESETSRPGNIVESATNRPGKFSESDSDMGNNFVRAIRPKLPPRDSSIPCVKRVEEDIKKNRHDISNNKPVTENAKDCTVDQGQHDRKTMNQQCVVDRENRGQITQPVASKFDVKMDVAQPVGRVVPPPRTVFKDTKSGHLEVQSNRDSTANQSVVDTRNELVNNNTTKNSDKPKKKESFVAALARMMEEARNSAIQGRKDEAEEVPHTRPETVTILTPSTGSSVDSQDPFYQFVIRNQPNVKPSISSEGRLSYQQNTSEYPKNYVSNDNPQNCRDNNPKSFQRQTNVFSANTTNFETNTMNTLSANTTTFETNAMRQPYDECPLIQNKAQTQQNSGYTRNESFHTGYQHQRDSGNPKTLSFNEYSLLSAGSLRNQFPSKLDNTSEVITISTGKNQLRNQGTSSQNDRLKEEFITISCQKENRGDSLYQDRTRLTSFGTARRSEPGVQVKQTGLGDQGNILKVR